MQMRALYYLYVYYNLVNPLVLVLPSRLLLIYATTVHMVYSLHHFLKRVLEVGREENKATFRLGKESDY